MVNQVWSKHFLMLRNHGILHYLWAADLSKSFPQLMVSIFTFLSQWFLLVFIISRQILNSVGLPDISYILLHWPILNQCLSYVETSYLVFTTKMSEKRLWKSDILSKDAGRWPTSLLKMSFFHRCFSNILVVKTNYLVSI